MRRLPGASALLCAVAVAVALLVPAATPATAGGSAPSANSDRWALVVGVSDYAGRTKSTVAGAADAEDFRQVLLRNGFAPDRIITLTERQATARNIRAGLQWLVDRSSPNAFSVFHFSGHVKQIGRDRDRDGEKLDEYLWPHDNVFISDAELAKYSRQLRGLAWIDIAGCEGAGLNDGISGPRRLFTASSRETEKSYENPEWKNSIFVGLEIDEAMLQGRGDSDRNGKVSIQEAFSYAADRAPHLTRHQRTGPQHPQAAGGDGSHWYLNGPPPPPPPPPPPRRSESPPEEPRCAQLICWS